MRPLRFLSILSLGVLVISAACSSAPEKPTPGTDASAVIAQFALNKGAKTILIPVTYGGTEHSFMLDTGTTETIFDNAFKPTLGEAIDTVHVRPIAGSSDPVLKVLYGAPDATVAGLSLKDCGRVSCDDLSRLRNALHADVRGILGMSFLRKTVVLFDPDEGSVAFLKPDDRAHPEWGAAIPLAFSEDGVPRVTAQVSSVGPVEFVVDSGSGRGGGLSPECFARAIRKPFGFGATVVMGRDAPNRVGRLEQLTLGPFEYRDLIFGQRNYSVIGMGILARHRVVFDFPQAKMYLRKGKSFDRPDEVDMAGLRFGLRVDTPEPVYQVVSVDGDSPAQIAGLQKGDLILKVGGQKATEYQPLEFEELLKSGDGKEIVMTIRRGAEERTVTVKLRRRF